MVKELLEKVWLQKIKEYNSALKEIWGTKINRFRDLEILEQHGLVEMCWKLKKSQRMSPGLKNLEKKLDDKNV